MKSSVSLVPQCQSPTVFTDAGDGLDANCGGVEEAADMLGVESDE